MVGMLLVLMVCSDEGCAAEVEAVVEFEELNALVCDCGCVLEAVAFSNVEAAELPVPA